LAYTGAESAASIAYAYMNPQKPKALSIQGIFGLAVVFCGIVFGLLVLTSDGSSTAQRVSERPDFGYAITQRSANLNDPLRPTAQLGRNLPASRVDVSAKRFTPKTGSH
jgi:hypothetical protein